MAKKPFRTFLTIACREQAPVTGKSLLAETGPTVRDVLTDLKNDNARLREINAEHEQTITILREAKAATINDSLRLSKVSEELASALTEESALLHEFLTRSGRAKSFAVWSGDVQRAQKAARAALEHAKAQS